MDFISSETWTCLHADVVNTEMVHGLYPLLMLPS